MAEKSFQLNKPALFTYHTALVDWLRFTCLWDDDLTMPSAETKRVFELLKANIGWVSDSTSNALYPLGYQKTFVYESDVKVGIDPTSSARVTGAHGQFIVDLSGSACRHFEERGGSWKELLCGLADMRVRFNRIDLAMDDIDGYFDMDTLKDKIHDQEFVSAFRACHANGKVCDETYMLAMPVWDDLDDSPEGTKIIDSRKGYTATFGSRASQVMLNIYDKKAERTAKASAPGVKEWVRFEASFLRNKCESVVRRLVVPALAGDFFGRVVAGIIHGLIEFKDTSGSKTCRDKNNHINRLPIWEPYRRFIGDVEAVKVPTNQAKVEESVQRTKKWAEGYWGNSLVKLLSCSDVGMAEVVCSVKKRVAEDGIPYSLVSQVLDYYKSLGRPCSLEDVLILLQTNFDMYDLDSSDSVSFSDDSSIEYDDLGRMRNPNLAVSTGREHVDVRGAFVWRLSKDWDKLDASLRSVVRQVCPFVDDLPALFPSGSVSRSTSL